MTDQYFPISTIFFFNKKDINKKTSNSKIGHLEKLIP